MFSRLFGKDKQAKVSTDTGEGKSAGISKLDSTIELLDKRIQLLEKKSNDEKTRATQLYAKKNVQGAMECMRRKKLYDGQIETLESQRNNQMTLKFTMENQMMNQELFKAQKEAKEELKKGNKKMEADRIEDNMEDLMEEVDKANQVSEAMKQRLDMNNVVDEDDLLLELQMEHEEQQREEAMKMPDMPKVPTTKLPTNSRKQQEADEMKQLEAELGL